MWPGEKTLDQVLRELALSKRHRESGQAEGRLEAYRTVLDLINQGYTLEQLKETLSAETGKTNRKK